MKNDKLLPLIIYSFLVVFITVYSFLIYGISFYIIVNFVFVLAFIVVIAWREFAFINQNQKLMSMFSFIEIVILNLNVQKTIDGAFSVIKPLLNEKLQTKIAAFKQSESTVIIQELGVYFAHQYYDSFLDLLMIYEKRGGDIIRMSEVLLHRIDGARATLNALAKIDQRYVIKFISNWLFIFTVSVVFRFSLSNIFAQINENVFFIVGNELLIVLKLTSLFFVNENKMRRSLNVS